MSAMQCMSDLETLGVEGLESARRRHSIIRTIAAQAVEKVLRPALVCECEHRMMADPRSAGRLAVVCASFEKLR
jgi:hypothetical protein